MCLDGKGGCPLSRAPPTRCLKSYSILTVGNPLWTYMPSYPSWSHFSPYHSPQRGHLLQSYLMLAYNSVPDPKWVGVPTSRSPQKDVSFLGQDWGKRGTWCQVTGLGTLGSLRPLEEQSTGLLTLSTQAGFLILICCCHFSVTWCVWHLYYQVGFSLHPGPGSD